MIRSKPLFSIVLLLFFLCSTAQETQKKQSLVSVLFGLENTFQVKFTYADNDIKDLSVYPLPDGLNLRQSITNLESQFPLSFKILNENLIAVTRLNTVVFCGVLKDKYTNELIEGATVQAKNQAVVSNTNGNFEIEVNPDIERVTIRYIGYKTLTFLGKDLLTKPCKTIVLIPQVESLSEVVVSNYLTSGINKRKNGLFEIDYNNFGILPGLIEQDVLQTVQALPGIQSIDERVSTINIRGGTNDQNLILWDGIKMYQSGHFFGLISALNPKIAAKVSLIKNGTPSYLTDGVSGTIILNSANIINDNLKAEVGLNLISADVYADVPLGQRSSFQISARRSINDIFETNTYNQFFDKAFQDTEVISEDQPVDLQEAFSFVDVNLRWNYQLSDKDLLRLNFISVSNNLVFLESVLTDSVIDSRESSALQNSLGGGILYQRKWNDQFSSDIQLYGTNYRLESSNVDILNDQLLLQENNVLETGVRFNNTIKLSDQLKINPGYQFVETGIENVTDVNNPIFRRAIKEVIVTHAAFSDIDYYPTEGTYFGGGLRVSYIQKFDEAIVEPRIRLNQNITDNISINLLGELKHQTTTQIVNFQNDFLGIENRRWVLSNENTIPIIKSQQLSFGIDYKPKDWLLSAEGYYKKVTGINAKSQSFLNQYQFQDAIGSYEITGADFLINMQQERLSTWLSYSIAKNDYTFETLQAEAFPSNFDIRHTINLAGAYEYKNFKISAGMNWHSGRPTTLLASQNINENNELDYHGANTALIDDYLRFDLSATYDFEVNDQVRIHTGASLWNIINSENIVDQYYRATNGRINEIQEQALNRTPNFTVRVEF
ncbi:TonB-dependent receptor plug domain-containing protein [Spongiivirga citrea]|uniref:TonB-dependent receptor n=1 Tax=Spongiivirga citrea TaxID=1481457 RepID=A0A6M0CF40_9FLAO|nr:carboxypeptidase-like regulatory domain-containing protein [Spongiivirga citrea]NER16455.1 TonB-dependent receptor [Spongiivirga citrea]